MKKEENVQVALGRKYKFKNKLNSHNINLSFLL